MRTGQIQACFSRARQNGKTAFPWSDWNITTSRETGHPVSTSALVRTTPTPKRLFYPMCHRALASKSKPDTALPTSTLAKRCRSQTATRSKAVGFQACAFAALLVCLFPQVYAEHPVPNSLDAMREGKALIQGKLTSKFTNVVQILEDMVHAYDAQHPADLWLDVLSVKDLQDLAQRRPKDLPPRLMLLPRELVDDKDCTNWFATLKEAYTLSTNEQERVTCLALAFASAFSLEAKGFGRPMLLEMKRWLDHLSSQRPSPAVAEKIKYLRLCVALGTEAYADVPIYAEDTPIRTMTPLWLMSKSKWELALTEVRRLKQRTDLTSEEERTLDFFESLLKGIVEKPSRARDDPAPAK